MAAKSTTTSGASNQTAAAISATGGSPVSSAPAANTADGKYIVVARRYRPQDFDQLVGQEHVAKALSNAIAAGRVGHAYLFTGARGVGKTSVARILAKALDCVQGPTAHPCGVCDICQGISSGGDVDVIEIDGASNRGIDEIRQLRQNVNVRPSRARFKIYIIDEVHMLTREAFNALLKTLEEPPEHVKFIFCTTESSKIPITILSRCQRFDFAGIRTPRIAERLRQIVDAEGVSAEPEALEIIARRASGSMRDSQSLLEQLLSFGGAEITAAEVHSLLGTAGDARLASLMRRLVTRDAAAALAEVDSALNEGVDVGQLLEQLLGYFRDHMVAAAGAGPEAFLFTSGEQARIVGETATRLGLASILACLQILEQTLGRLRHSTQGRMLAELAIVRICQLDDLSEMSEMVSALRTGALTLPAMGARSAALPGPEPVVSTASQAGNELTNGTKKKAGPLAVADADAAKEKVAELAPVHSEASAYQSATDSQLPPAGLATPRLPLLSEQIAAIWRQAIASFEDLLHDFAGQASRVELADAAQQGDANVANLAPTLLAVYFPRGYTSGKAFCERPEQLARLEQACGDAAERPIRLALRLEAEPVAAVVQPVARTAPTSRQAMVEVADHPLVARAAELFGARVVRVDRPATDA